MIRHSYKLQNYIDPNIKVGHIVRMIDGSGLSFMCDPLSEEWERDYAIVSAYPELTGLSKILMDCDAKVIETGVSNYIRIGVRTAYVQDIVVEIGTAKFRTCSMFVTNLREKKLLRILN